jgi:uncharacterized protein YndB with AHSA1/START domain
MNMKIDYTSDQPVTNGAAAAATGKNLEVWFQELDKLGGPSKGRKVLGDYLLKSKVHAWWITTILVEYEKSRGVLEKDGLPKGYNICVTKSVAAPAQRAYDALLDMRAWLGAGSACEAKDGGKFRDAEGHHGVFKKLNAGKLIRFTWEGAGHAAGETVEIKLSPSGAKTSVVLTHERLPDRAAADGMRAAWGRVLAGLKERVE